MMRFKWSFLAIALGSALAWTAVRSRAWGPRSVAKPWTDLRCNLERYGIRWSTHFLRSMGAVQSAPQAEQDALLAQRVSCAVVDRLDGRVSDFSVLVIGRVIHLEGQVTSLEDRAEAERVAYEVSGARIIADDLRVQQG